MADNTELASGSGGDVLRTEDRSGVKTPVSLIDVGGSSPSAEAIIGDSGVAMPVRGLAAENAAVSGNPVLMGGRYDATPRTLGDGDVGAPALTVNGYTIVSVTGTVTVGSHAVTNAGTFVVQVDGTALTRLTDIETNTDFGTVIGGGTEAAALRVTIASNSTGVLSVDDNGASLTVDGTVAATQSGTWTVDLGATDNAVLDAIAASLAGTLTVGAHAVTNAGTFAVQAAQSGTWNVGTVTTVTTVSTVTNVAAIGTSVTPGTSAAHLGKAEDAAHSSGDTGVFMLAVRSDTAAATGQTDGDYTALVTDSTGKLWVNVGNTVTVGSHAVTNAGTFAVQVDGSALTALQLIDDPVFADDAAFTIGTSKVMMQGATVDESSTDSADEGDAVAVRATANRQLVTTVRPNASGEGLDIFRSIDLDESEEEVKGSPGKLYGYYFYNASASVRYLKFYNDTAANVSVGSTTPVMTLPLPPTSAGHVEFTNGIPFSAAICAAATTGLADNDTGAPSANDVILNVFYK